MCGSGVPVEGAKGLFFAEVPSCTAGFFLFFLFLMITIATIEETFELFLAAPNGVVIALVGLVPLLVEETTLLILSVGSHVRDNDR